MYARAIYDFTAGNNRELSISKGDLVQVSLEQKHGGPRVLLILTIFSLVIKQVVKRSSHWWLVRSRGEEGSVPQNVLELVSSGPAEDQQVS